MTGRRGTHTLLTSTCNSGAVSFRVDGVPGRRGQRLFRVRGDFEFEPRPSPRGVLRAGQVSFLWNPRVKVAVVIDRSTLFVENTCLKCSQCYTPSFIRGAGSWHRDCAF